MPGCLSYKGTAASVPGRKSGADRPGGGPLVCEFHRGSTTGGRPKFAALSRVIPKLSKMGAAAPGPNDRQADRPKGRVVVGPGPARRKPGSGQAKAGGDRVGDLPISRSQPLAARKAAGLSFAKITIPPSRRFLQEKRVLAPRPDFDQAPQVQLLQATQVRHIGRRRARRPGGAQRRELRRRGQPAPAQAPPGMRRRPLRHVADRGPRSSTSSEGPSRNRSNRSKSGQAVPIISGPPSPESRAARISRSIGCTTCRAR